MPSECAGRTIGQPYAGVFYANNFSYLLDPCLPFYDSRSAFARLTDQAKRIDLGFGSFADFGGETRLRYQDENNFARSRLDGRDNDFTLTRLRLYGNVELGQNLRFFVEMIDARSAGEEYTPRAIEEVHADLLNAFAEIRGTIDSTRAYVRGGRQELLFGAQRLISPLDWGNTRRSFDGGRAGIARADLEVSAWYAHPRVINSDYESETDDNVSFSGVYATYRPGPGMLFDAYGLRLATRDNPAGDKSIWTLGGRHAGRAGQVFWEVEAAYQFGDQDIASTGRNADVRAGMLTAGVGYDFANLLPWKPSLSVYYDLATGDADPGDGTIGTFDQLFPLGHAFFGFMDLVGRRNIRSVSMGLTAQPIPWLKVGISGHQFWLDRDRDALYNAAGAAIRRDATGRAGDDVGREVDLTATIALMDRVEILLGYSKFWGGSFIDATNPPGVSGNADFFYAQVTTRF